MRPESIPEDVLEVNGFRYIKSNEYHVEWRDVGSNRVANVWVTYESTPNFSPGWEVAYEVRRRGGSKLLDHGSISEHRAEDFDEALASAVSFMRRNGSGSEDLSGGLSAGADLDFSGW